MADEVDIRALSTELAKALGVPAKKWVKEIHLTPTEATVTVYSGSKGDYEGDKYIDPNTNEAALQTFTVPIQT